MSRLPGITSKEALPADQQHIFDEIAASRGGRIPGPFPYLLNSPEVAGRLAHLGTFLRYEAALPPMDRELAFCVAAQKHGCEPEFRGHSRLAQQEGAPEGLIDAIGQNGPLDAFTAEQTLAVRFARELVNDNKVSDATFEEARARYGDRGVVDLTAGIGYYTVVAFALNNLA